VNGIYIPGDTKLNFETDEFVKQVANILKWVQDHNLDSASHFPLISNSYGMMAMLKSQLPALDRLIEFPDEMMSSALQMNLNLLPKETFVYDEFNGHTLEILLDAVTFYNEMDVGITLEDFIFAGELRHFVPVATYDHGADVLKEDEIVSMVEGTYLPIFGFGYRVDKIQFGFHAMNGEGQAKVDHSKKAIMHAQHIANFLVDEARLSGNSFEWTNDE